MQLSCTPWRPSYTAAAHMPADVLSCTLFGVDSCHHILAQATSCAPTWQRRSIRSILTDCQVAGYQLSHTLGQGSGQWRPPPFTHTQQQPLVLPSTSTSTSTSRHLVMALYTDLGQPPSAVARQGVMVQASTTGQHQDVASTAARATTWPGTSTHTAVRPRITSFYTPKSTEQPPGVLACRGGPLPHRTALH